MTVFETNLTGINFINRGKVRDIYELDEGLLIIATDRLSAFDVVMPTPIPDKGTVLTQMSLFWFDFFKDVTKHHLITADVSKYPQSLAPFRDILDGRSMLVKKLKPLPVECIVRGYLSGSGWKDYKKTGSVCGIKLPDGLKESDKLPEPIFTPSTKAEIGLHDENIDFEKTKGIIGSTLAEQIKELSLQLYKKAAEHAYSRGIIIADTKFEFGMDGDELYLIDEVLTPDSSRFWPLNGYASGKSQPSFDKQFVRDYLETLNWGKTPPGPELPPDIVEKTAQKYRAALSLLTGA